MKKKAPVWKNSYYLLAGLIAVTLAVVFMSSDLVPFTTVANQPEEFVLDANIVLVTEDETFKWDMEEQFPDALKEEGINGSIVIGVEIVSASVDILSIHLSIEGPVDREFDLAETATDDWTYVYDTAELLDGTYVFTLEGEIDTSPLYRTDEGGIETFRYDAFNVVWENGSGTPEEILGIPYEYAVIGGIVIVLLLFTGKKKQNQTIVVMQPASQPYQ